MNQAIVYTEHQSPRCNYIVHFLFKTILGLAVEITTNTSDFEQASSFKINYSSNKFACDLQIIPNGLLHQTKIETQLIAIDTWHDLPMFFKTSDLDIPFDLFSAAFYLVSRYEEYLPFKHDEFGRFPYEESLASKHNFLHLPLIDLWMKELKHIIQIKSKHIEFLTPNFTFIPTYDIDIAYSYKAKGFLRNVFGTLRDVCYLKFSKVSERIMVLNGKAADPYDSFAFLEALHEKYNLKPIYFFLLSDGGKLDKNINPNHDAMQALINSVKLKASIGIHPSVSSHDSQQVLLREIKRINSTLSRQHYIKFILPQTFQNLIDAGINNDYSMGYGSINGFRASTSFSHQWFNISKNEVTTLTLHPFCFMECNSFFEQKYTQLQTLEELVHYLKIIKSVNGQMISIWHNFSLGTDQLWKGWREMYEQFIDKINKEHE